MGGAGSKSAGPVKESARAVLARQAPKVAPPAPTAAADATAAAAPVLAKRQHKAEDFMDPGILKEMSSWGGAIRSEVDQKTLELRQGAAAQGMATVIRFNEEKQQMDRFGRAPKTVLGKLTEEQIVSLFASSKAGIASDALSKEFGVEKATIDVILKTARAPTIRVVSQAGSKKQSLLNELRIAS